MKTAVMTGAAGFAGFSLLQELLEQGYRVICMLRPDSPHNERVRTLAEKWNSAREPEKVESGIYTREPEGTDNESARLITLELSMEEIRKLPELISEKYPDLFTGEREKEPGFLTGEREKESGFLTGETKNHSDPLDEGTEDRPVFFHLAWTGGRDDFDVQYRNVDIAVGAAEAAAALGCRRILFTGSQAEYGLQEKVTDEDTVPKPFSAYGAAKTAALYLTKRKAEQLDLEWIWGRIFSLYGRYEPPGTMLQYLLRSLKEGQEPVLSSCTQTWDYLDASDAARALRLLMERGRSGEIYNIASGDMRPLREFVEAVRRRAGAEVPVRYGSEEKGPLVSLRPSVEKLRRDTLWEPSVPFPEGLFPET